MRTITLTVNQAQFFDEVSKYGLINSTCPIGSRVIACLLGGVDFREAVGLAVYGVQVFEGEPALSSEAPAPADAPSGVISGKTREEPLSEASTVLGLRGDLRASVAESGGTASPKSDGLCKSERSCKGCGHPESLGCASDCAYAAMHDWKYQ